MSPFPIPCVSRQRPENILEQSTTAVDNKLQTASFTHAGDRISERGQDDWVRDINTLLKFNATFGGRGTLSGNGGFEDEEG